jgi:hypothetical protein
MAAVAMSWDRYCANYVYRRPGGGEAAISKRLAHYEPCPHCRKPEPQR